MNYLLNVNILLQGETKKSTKTWIRLKSVLEFKKIIIFQNKLYLLHLYVSWYVSWGLILQCYAFMTNIFIFLKNI